MVACPLFAHNTRILSAYISLLFKIWSAIKYFYDCICSVNQHQELWFVYPLHMGARIYEQIITQSAFLCIMGRIRFQVDNENCDHCIIVSFMKLCNLPDKEMCLSVRQNHWQLSMEIAF